MAENYVEINCTTEGSCRFSNPQIVLTEVDGGQTRIDQHDNLTRSSENQRCTYRFNVRVSQNIELNCVERPGVDCTSNETISIIVLPHIIIEADTTSSQEILYICKAPCVYETLRWYIDDMNTNPVMDGIVDKDFVRNRNITRSSTSNCNGFHTLTLTLNVSTKDFNDILPTLTCGARLKGGKKIQYSDQITRTINTTVTTIPPPYPPIATNGTMHTGSTTVTISSAKNTYSNQEQQLFFTVFLVYCMLL